MNKKNIFYSTISLLLLQLFVSCGSSDKNQTNVDVIKINPREASEFVNLSEIVDSIEYITLKTDKNNPMGHVVDLIVRDKYIYACTLQPNAIFVFDKKGQFVSKLDKEGRGPGEYLYIAGLFVDENEEYIEILDDEAILKYKNIEFEFVQKSTIPYVTFNSSARDGNTYYLTPQQNPNTVNDKRSNPDLIIVRNGEIIKTLFDKKIKTANDNNHTTWHWPNTESFCLNDKNETFLSVMYDNTFYQLNDTVATPILSVDFGKYGIDNHKLRVRPLYEQVDYIKSMRKFASFPVLNINSEDLMVCSYNFKSNDVDPVYGNDIFGNVYHYIKVKGNNTVFHTKQIRNDITDFPEYVDFCSYLNIRHQPQYKDYIVDVITPINHIGKKNEIDTKAVGKVTMEDNPIVMLMKLKK